MPARVRVSGLDENYLLLNTKGISWHMKQTWKSGFSHTLDLQTIQVDKPLSDGASHVHSTRKTYWSAVGLNNKLMFDTTFEYLL